MADIGISCYLTSIDGCKATIGRCQSLGMNTIRYASREAWLDQPTAQFPNGQGNRAFHKEYVDYILANSNLKIILDLNHVYYTTNGSFDVDAGSVWIQNHWTQIIEWIKTVAQMYANNDRVAIEGINEYSLADFWTRCQNLISEVRTVSTITLVFNKWNQAWTKLADSHDKYSYHYYFNDEYWSVSGAIADIDNGLSKGLMIVCTEIGANSNGASSATTTQVQRLNEFVKLCSDRNVGCMLWNTNNDQDFAMYLSKGLSIPQATEPVPNGDGQQQVSSPYILILAVIGLFVMGILVGNKK